MKRDWGILILGFPMIAFLLLPPLVLLGKGGAAIPASLQSPEVREAVALSLRTTLVSLGLTVLFGTPVAVGLARNRRRGIRLLATALELPIVLPPAAAGIGLLLAFGRAGVVPTSLAFTVGAVIAAQTFVSAPLYIRGLAEAVSLLDPELAGSAALDGAGVTALWSRILLPALRPALGSALALTWARALGEFGATLLFAGNFPGVTQTMPLAIYMGFESDLERAISLSALLLISAAGILIGARLIEASASPRSWYR